MDYFPLFVELKNQACLVVGGGSIAARKISLLAKAGASITVVAPDFTPELCKRANHEGITLRQKAFEEQDVADFRLVIAATDNDEVNRKVSEAATARGIWINVVDRPSLCSFIFPAIVDRTPLMVAISSGGASPVLARLMRAKIETLLPSTYGKLAKLAEKFRVESKSRMPSLEKRRQFWEKVLQGTVAEFVFQGREQEAEELLRQALDESSAEPSRCGEVYLVGAGPGDPDLLTFRALRLMQQADVVLYDRLVSDEILELVRRDAERIYVGKRRDQHSVPQDSINQLLADLALAGKRVVRLKGGDPFIFGRGGEEIETLMTYGIPFQVVPGITAASGCSSYAGIPLTHRDHAQSCVFVTGHLKDGSISLNWPQLVQPNQTVVIYMGLVGLPVICSELIAHGASRDLPIALVEQGTTSRQRVYTATLGTMSEWVAGQDINPPTLIIIGTVVTLREKLAWF